MPYTPILATLAYLVDAERKRTLMVHRNKRADDQQLGKYNGLGGKVEAGESVFAGLCREVREEAAVEVVKASLRGTISWPGFGKAGEDWFGFVFLVESFRGIPLAENAEGALEWVAIDDLLKLPLWEGDHHFLPMVFGPHPGQFHGVMPYAGGKMVSWAYQWA